MPSVTIDEGDPRIAAEHPRGTERRTLLPYRDALNDATAYARLALVDRDVIVRWVEVRRRLAEDGLDHDDANLADPLLPYARLRAHVLAGEYVAAGITGSSDPGGDLQGLVGLVRARRAG